MIRVLHLTESDAERAADFQTRRSVRHLSQDLGGGFEGEVRTVGKQGDWNNVFAAVRGMRQVVEFDVVHAWGLRALWAAVLGTRIPVVYSPSPTADAKSVRWLQALTGYRDVQVVCPTASLRRAMVRVGVPIEKCHLVRPGVEFARIRRRRDRDLRERLRLDDRDVVLLAAGETTPRAGHVDVAWASGILHVMDPRYKLLLWGQGDALEETVRFTARLKNQPMLRVAERVLGTRLEFEELLPAADMVVNGATGATATLPICMAMAAGLPIVSTVTYTAGELLEDRHTAVMVPKRSARLMAQKVLQLHEDAELQWRLSDMARTEAYEYFSLTRFLDQWRGVYRQWSKGERVEVVEPAAGAGLRFHGRG